MQARFRSDYDGEFVIVNTVWRNGRKEQQREWIENPIEMNNISPRAVVIGNSSSRNHFPIHRLEGHKGGLLGRLRLQSYGAQGCWKELQLDFYCAEKNELQEIVDNGYQERSIVYTNAKNCIAFPGEFYLTPYSPVLSGVASAAYLAAFDEHPEVYLVGVDGYDTDSNVVKKHIDELDIIFGTYTDVKWVVASNGTIPDQWKTRKNVEQWNYDKFVSYCDV